MKLQFYICNSPLNSRLAETNYQLSFQFCCSIVSHSLRPHGLQHTSTNALELVQTHDHQVSDSIQPSHPLSSPSPPAFNLSQHEGLFQWVVSLHQVTKVLEFQLQPSVLPKNILDWFPLRLTSLISLQSTALSRVFSNTIGQKHEFFSTQLSLWSNSHIHTWPLEKP